MRKLAIATLALGASLTANAWSMIEDSYRELLLPRLSFTNAPVTDVAHALERVYAEQAKSHYANPLQTWILVHPSCTNTTVTLDIEDVTMHEVLEKLNWMYGIDSTRQSGRQHTLLSKGENTPMFTGIYNVLPSVFPDSQVGGTDVAAFFSRLGVRFPEGASAHHLPASGKLVVHNTRSELNELEVILARLNVVPDLVEASLRVVRVDDADLAKRVAAHPASTNVHSLVTTSDTLFHLTTLVASGHTVTNELAAKSSGAKSGGSTVGSARFVLTPSLSPDQRLLSFPLQASLAFPVGRHGQIEYALQTSLVMSPGASMLAWLSPPADGENDAPTLCLVVSARLIDPAGLPIVNEPLDLHEGVAD